MLVITENIMKHPVYEIQIFKGRHFTILSHPFKFYFICWEMQNIWWHFPKVDFTSCWPSSRNGPL